MATFVGRAKQTIQIHAPKQRVAETLSNPARIKDLLADNLESGETLDEHTLHVVRKPVEEKGVKFRGDYTVRYEYNGESTVTWQTISHGNMRSTGEARLSAVADDTTSVEYSESIECDMEVNRLLGAVLRPIVEHKIKSGVTDHLRKLKASLEAA